MLMIKGAFCTVKGDGREIYEDIVRAILTVHSAVAKKEGKEYADEFIVAAGRDAMNLDHNITPIINESREKHEK
ncbi:MAG: hypothetical protein Q4C46_05655 [Bacillota bacterium]|nr:hypothetical protein [Bacillota bacterium]